MAPTGIIEIPSSLIVMAQMAVKGIVTTWLSPEAFLLTTLNAGKLTIKASCDGWGVVPSGLIKLFHTSVEGEVKLTVGGC